MSNTLAHLKRHLTTIQANQQTKLHFETDPRLFRIDATYSGLETWIRFLPAFDETESPIRAFSRHTFKKGKWTYMEPCVEGEPCAFCDYIQREGMRGRTNPYYAANIVVLDDPRRPDRNGRVFLFEFGKQIFNKITEMVEVEMNPFDINEGYDFHLCASWGQTPQYTKFSYFATENICQLAESLHGTAVVRDVLSSRYDLATYPRVRPYEDQLESLSRVLDVRPLREEWEKRGKLPQGISAPTEFRRIRAAS